MACANYQADVLAAEFGQCKCGYPKQAHVIASENKAAAAKRALRSSTREVPKLLCEPCSEYVVDVSASTFGHCYCGHPKEAHLCKSENKAAAERAKLDEQEQESLRLSTRTANMLEPCSEFKVDTKAEKFGMCICGHLQDAHKATTINAAEVERARLDTKAKERQSLCVSVRTSNTCEPCSDFKVDTKAAKFGVCMCGHPQDAHKITIVNPAEAALRAMKEKNTKKASLCEESDPKTENGAVDISANLCEESSDPGIEDNTMAETSPYVETKLNRADEKPILKLPLRHDFGFGMRCCSECGSFCRNRGCEDSNQVFCHRCWPNYIRGNGNGLVPTSFGLPKPWSIGLVASA